jgi:molybdopterin-guanine dinucleotide biosynthesis protein MobB
MRLSPPVLGFAAFSGTGKTTLLAQLVPLLREQGLRVGLIKHGHHHFEVDVPGKDSYRLRRAGATQVLIASAKRTVRLTNHVTEPLLAEALRHLAGNGMDIILVEGFKHQPLPKIELHRPSLGYPLLCRDDPAVLVVASDAPLRPAPPVPVLDLNDLAALAAFIRDWWLNQPHRSTDPNRANRALQESVPWANPS